MPYVSSFTMGFTTLRPVIIGKASNAQPFLHDFRLALLRDWAIFQLAKAFV